jgi:hypothetical protein
MRWTLAAASALLAASLWLPSQAASPSDPPAARAATTGEPITFEQYRDWRIHFIERRQAQIAQRLKASDLSATQKDRLEQQKAYYDWLAGMSSDERDRRFRERFDLIDANHDGKIDEAERAAWHDKQQARYRHETATTGTRR